MSTSLGAPFEGLLRLEGSLRGGCATSDRLDDPNLRAEARALVPLDTLHERREAANGTVRADGLVDDERDGLLRQLLAWFKFEFFSWVNSPKCDACGGATRSVGMAAPTADDRAGGAARVELYRCKACSAHTRFPRYNDARRLLRTRRGRCGEWANAFTLFCRALGFTARYVLDMTDHVWTEVWSEQRGRWLHADSCENRLDAPLMYCTGWKKKLTYIFAFGPGEAVDVVHRYVTSDAHAAVLARRSLASEAWVAARLAVLDERRRAAVSPGAQRACAARRESEAQELARPAQPRTSRPAELDGRQTGSVEWRRARGEIGDGGGADAPCDSEAARGGGAGALCATAPAGGAATGEPFVWSVALEPGVRKWRVRYSAQRDAYYVGGTDDTPARKRPAAVRGWRAGMATSDNMRRAEEEDWNMVYLAREDGERDASGEWRFLAQPGTRIVGGSALLTHSLHADGARVRWRVSRDDGASWRTLGAPTDAPVSLERALAAADARGQRSATHPLDGCELLRLRVELSGGTWQSTQLFRQSRTLLDAYLLDVRLALQPEGEGGGSDGEARAVQARASAPAHAGPSSGGSTIEAANASAAPAPAARAASGTASAATAAPPDLQNQVAALFATLMQEERWRADPTGAAAEAIRRLSSP